jgi:uncharacterized protein YaaN involved in tellurite resistance
MKEVGVEKLAQDYEIVLKEYFGKFNTIQELYSRFQNENNEWNKRWNSFAEGYKELQSTEIIEDYFYTENFVKIYQEKLIEYVKANPTKLYKIE